MALPNTKVRDGFLFHAPCSRFIDSYLGAKLSHIWRHLYTDFRHFINLYENEGKPWLYAYKKSNQTLGNEMGLTRETINRSVDSLEKAGCLIRIPSASNGHEGVALIVFDPASIGYEKFIDVAFTELKRQQNSGNKKAGKIMANFLSLILEPRGEARVTINGDSARECIYLFDRDDQRKEPGKCSKETEEERYWDSSDKPQQEIVVLAEDEW